MAMLKNLRVSTWIIPMEIGTAGYDVELLFLVLLI
jgi:hypothetical protein